MAFNRLVRKGSSLPLHENILRSLTRFRKETGQPSEESLKDTCDTCAGYGLVIRRMHPGCDGKGRYCDGRRLEGPPCIVGTSSVPAGTKTCCSPTVRTAT